MYGSELSPEIPAGRRGGRGSLRRVFLVGCPRSRTTPSQNIISLACNLATMKSTNWYLEHPMTRLLNGMEGMSRADARRWASDRVCAHVLQVTGIVLPTGFRLEDGMDTLATATGASGWLEKTPMHILGIPEIEADIPDAQFVHIVRDPTEVVTSLIRRARDNPTMIGSRHQLDQKNDEATWRQCIQATLQQAGKSNHCVIDSESFVDDPESQAARVATFLHLPYRAPDDPGRMKAATAPTDRPWRKDAAGPVQRTAHDDDRITLEPLDSDTESLWHHAQHALNIPSR
jgi:Sulfotransferase family